MKKLALISLVAGSFSFQCSALIVPALESPTAFPRLVLARQCDTVAVCEREDGLPIILAPGNPDAVAGKVVTSSDILRGGGKPVVSHRDVVTGISIGSSMSAASVMGLSNSLSLRMNQTVEFDGGSTPKMPGGSSFSFFPKVSILRGKSARIDHSFVWIVTDVTIPGRDCPSKGEVSISEGGRSMSTVAGDVVIGSARYEIKDRGVFK